ncbi:apoptosis-antagonizing transcription factor [Crassisporium funariophilum]|nr:apoptosis-antagonizing transcription factor [Crassisporium funariophilum]
MTTERLSLAEQIAQLEEAAPADYDPEDVQFRGADAENAMQVDTSASRKHYLEVGPSSLRKLQSIAAPKYVGVRTSRKQLMESLEGGISDSADDDDDEEEDEDDINEGSTSPEMEGDDIRGHNLELNRDASDGSGPSESEGSASESGNEEQDDGRASMTQNSHSQKPLEDSTPVEDMSTVLKQTREQDLKKGQAVKRQVALWDTLLDTRIRLQKSVVLANKLPPPAQIKEYLETPECRDAMSNLLQEAALLTDVLFSMQENLLTTNEVITPPPRKRRKLDSAASIDDHATNLSAAAGDAAALEQTFHPYLVQTLSKWSSKIQAVAPSVLLPSNRGTFLKGTQNLKSAVQLTDETLADHEKLLTRTQITRGKRARIGVPLEEDNDASDMPDPEIFDDTDFYQKMLRDIIHARGNSDADQDWMMLQKQKKAKKKVDTKASKGRKLRYEVHEKLQNFMVPVPVPGSWHDEQVDELFSSLLGKGYENVGITADAPQVEQSIALGGFRVFG